MYKDEFDGMLNGWEDYLKSLKTKMKVTIKTFDKILIMM
jgi:hypothetical protein